MKSHRFTMSRFAGGIIRVLQAGTVIFSLLPAVLVFVLSFSRDSILYFPSSQWGLDLYQEIATSPVWIGAIATSFKIGLCAAALALISAAPAAYAIARRPGLLAGICEYASLGPLVVPLASFSVGLYFVFLKLHLIGSFAGLVLAHAVLGMPVVVIVLLASLRRIPGEYEMVAISLGATRRRAAIDITARLLMPGFLAAFIFAFLTSFDDAVLVSFLGGPGVLTLSKAIFDSMQFSLDPAIAAVSALLMVATAALIAVASILRRRAV
jgi:putative spermidine/putrescine transport system permease protein